MKLSEVPHSVEFLSKTTLLQLLSSIIRFPKLLLYFHAYNIFVLLGSVFFTFVFWSSNESAESILRSRAMMIIGRLLSAENAFVFIDESSKIWKFSLSAYAASQTSYFPSLRIVKIVLVKEYSIPECSHLWLWNISHYFHVVLITRISYI